MIAEILLIVLSGVAAVFDLEYRKIPNLVIATGIFCGLFLCQEPKTILIRCIGIVFVFLFGMFQQTIKLTLRQLSLKNVQVFEQKEFPFAPFIFASCVLYGILRSLHVC